jgi:hypothetical protein
VRHATGAHRSWRICCEVAMVNWYGFAKLETKAYNVRDLEMFNLARSANEV